MKVRALKSRFYRKRGGPRGWGLRCKDYGPGCPLCEFYRFYDDFGGFPTAADEEVMETRTLEAQDGYMKEWYAKQAGGSE